MDCELVMFKKKKAAGDDSAVSLVQNYASQLGIERRQSVRVRYPSLRLTSLPQVRFEAHELRVQDMSVGGCCLLDENEHLGPSVGVDVELNLNWLNREYRVRSRIVAYVHLRRHIQFMDQNAEMAQLIKQALAPGALGLAIKPLMGADSTHLDFHAHEAWASLNGESISFVDDVHVAAEIHVGGSEYLFLRNAWPVRRDRTAATLLEVESLLVFLENIPQPSSNLITLKAQMQTIYEEGQP